MKKYSLKCPSCLENRIYICAESPEVLHRMECDEEINLADVREVVAGWKEYLDDLDAFLANDEREVKSAT